MSKYNALWEYISENGADYMRLNYDEIEKISGAAVDHSFLNYKKEILEYGYKVGKISMKEKTIEFIKS